MPALLPLGLVCHLQSTVGVARQQAGSDGDWLLLLMLLENSAFKNHTLHFPFDHSMYDSYFCFHLDLTLINC